MLPRMQDRVRVLLAAVGEDPEREGLKDTPKVSAVRGGLADGWGRRRTKRQESNRSTPTHCWCVRAVPLSPASPTQTARRQGLPGHDGRLQGAP